MGANEVPLEVVVVYSGVPSFLAWLEIPRDKCRERKSLCTFSLHLLLEKKIDGHDEISLIMTVIVKPSQFSCRKCLSCSKVSHERGPISTHHESYYNR